MTDIRTEVARAIAKQDPEYEDFGLLMKHWRMADSALRVITDSSPARFAETNERITQGEMRAVFGGRFSMQYVAILLQDHDDGPIGARRELNRALDEDSTA